MIWFIIWCVVGFMVNVVIWSCNQGYLTLTNVIACIILSLFGPLFFIVIIVGGVIYLGDKITLWKKIDE